MQDDTIQEDEYAAGRHIFPQSLIDSLRSYLCYEEDDETLALYADELYLTEGHIEYCAMETAAWSSDFGDLSDAALPYVNVDLWVKDNIDVLGEREHGNAYIYDHDTQMLFVAS